MKYSLKYFACGLLILSAASCSNDLKQVENITAKSQTAEISTGVEAIYSDSAKVRARLAAPVMVRRDNTDDPTVEMPKGVSVNFYDTSLNVTSKLKADYGIRYVNRNLTKVTGDVVVVNQKGDTLNTEELYWDEPKEKVYSNKFVKVKTENEIILSEGFESDINFTHYKFYRTKGIISISQ